MKLWSLAILLLIAGCAAEESASSARAHNGDSTAKKTNDPNDANGDGIPDDEQPPGVIACTKTGRSYAGLAGTLEAGRPSGTLGGERDRIKPYSVLKTDLTRVLGTAPKLEGSAFGEYTANADPFENHYHDNNRDGHTGEPTDVTTWYVEPTSGALEVYSTVEAAFDACTKYVAQNPAADCKTMARAFWSRTPIPAEITACEDSAKNSPAWGCTTLVTSANFLSY